MSKARDIEILEYKIEELQKKIDVFIERNISDKKRENLEALKLKYETDLENLKQN